MHSICNHDDDPPEPKHGGTVCPGCKLWLTRPPNPETWTQLTVRVNLPKVTTTVADWALMEMVDGLIRRRNVTFVVSRQSWLNDCSPFESVQRAAVSLDDMVSAAYADACDVLEDLADVPRGTRGGESRVSLVKGDDGVWTLDRDMVAVEMTVSILPNTECVR